MPNTAALLDVARYWGERFTAAKTKIGTDLTAWLESEGLNRAGAELTYDLIRWLYHYGRPVFVLTEDLVIALEHSAVEDLNATDCHLPFPCLLIELPARYKCSYGETLLNVFLTEIVLGDNTEGLLCRFQFPGDLVLEEPIHSKFWRDLVTAAPLQTKDYGLNDRAMTDSVRHVLVGALAYINECRAAAGESTKSTSSTPRLHRDGPADRNRWIVGREVRLAPEIRAAMSGTSDELRQLTVRYVVRGHWRQQAYGTAHAKHRPTWIAPYWKGPKDIADALLRTYRVERPRGTQ